MFANTLPKIVPALAASLLLGACATTPRVVTQTVTVTKVQYVPLPGADLMPCYYPLVPITNNASLLLSQQGAIRSLQVCNRQLDDLRALNAKVTP